VHQLKIRHVRYNVTYNTAIDVREEDIIKKIFTIFCRYSVLKFC